MKRVTAERTVTKKIMNNRAMFHEVSREDVGEIRDELDKLSRSVNSLTSMAANANAYTAHMCAANSRKKRRILKAELADANGCTIAVVYYDDGTCCGVDFFEGVSGIGEIMVISSPEEIEIPEIADISFTPYGKHVTVTLPTIGSRLYMAFREAGIFFNTKNFSEREISRLLEKYYIPLFNKQPRILARILPGWYEDSFVTGEHYDWFEGRIKDLLKKIPLARKYFTAGVASGEDLISYIRILKNIKNPELRILVLVQPFLSMLASIIQEPIPVLNFIVEGQARFALAYMMQVFERHKPMIHYTADTPSKMQKILSEVRDETVLFGADINSFMTPYEQNKMRANIHRILNVFDGDDILSAPYMRKVTAGGVIFSNFEMADSRLIKVYVAEDDYDPAFLKYAAFGNKDIPGMVFSAFVVFAEKHIFEIKERLRNSNLKDTVEIYLLGFEILEKLFYKAGIDLRKSLEIENIRSILENTQNESEDDVAGIFRKIMRNAIQEIVTVQKKYADYPDEMMVYYNDDFVWIPSKLLN